MTLADRIEKRIQEIPAHSSMYIATFPDTLKTVLSSELIRKIAEEAAAEAEKKD